MITLLSPADRAEFSLLTPALEEFVRQEYAKFAVGLDPKVQVPYFAPWRGELLEEGFDTTVQAVLTFRWQSDKPTALMKFRLSLTPDFSAQDEHIATVSKIFASADPRGEYFVNVENLLTGTTYYWTVDDGSGCTEVRSFTTKPNEIRSIHIDGASNARDLGGFCNKDGRRMRQGMIYRGTALESEVMEQFRLTDAGRQVMVKDLGIRTELDLRKEAEEKGLSSSVIGEDIQHYCIPIGQFDYMLWDIWDDNICKVFKLLAEESSYPLYFHCQGGADRTGCLSIALKIVLGMELNEEMVLDFNYTVSRTWWSEFIQKMYAEFEQRYPGHTIEEQFLLHLKKVGVTDEDMAKIRSILLE